MRERKLRDILNDINQAVTHLDRQKWIDEMKRLFKNYVSSELGKVVKKDPECIEEMEE